MAQIDRDADKRHPPAPLIETKNAARLMGFHPNPLVKMRMRAMAHRSYALDAASAIDNVTWKVSRAAFRKKDCVCAPLYQRRRAAQPRPSFPLLLPPHACREARIAARAAT
jgi:hypothetical protein